MTNLINFLGSVKDDSTDFQQTLNTFASAVSTAQTNLDGALASEPYLTWKTAINNSRNTVNDQITKEVTNIGGIRAYVKSLVNTQSYVTLAENTKLNDIIKQSSGSTAWQDYYSKYEERKKDYNPIYNYTSDSSNTSTIEQVMRLRGLPDVLNHHDLVSVGKKLLKDTRLSSAISNEGKTVEELIEKSCQLLGIEIEGRDVYSQSKLLLDNMNKHDVDSIKKELENSQATDTLT
jgi:regulator of replication initiation timing